MSVAEKVQLTISNHLIFRTETPVLFIVCFNQECPPGVAKILKINGHSVAIETPQTKYKPGFNHILGAIILTLLPTLGEHLGFNKSIIGTFHKNLKQITRLTHWSTV